MGFGRPNARQYYSADFEILFNFVDGSIESRRLVRVFRRMAQFSMVPDEDGVLRHMTVAQAFFKYGNETMVKRLTNGRTQYLDEEEDEDDEIIEARRKGSFPLIYLSNKVTTNFSKFLYDTLDAAIVTLWPESTGMALPRFLTQNCYYEALQVIVTKKHANV